MIEYTDEQHDSLIRGHRKQLADVQATVEALQAKCNGKTNHISDTGNMVLAGDYEALAQRYRHLERQVEALQAQLAAAQKVKADYDRWLSGGVYFTTVEYKKHVAEHQQQIEALQAQLPAEMQGCTILFKECEKGHGRLVATNWRDHGCQTCEVEALQAQIARAKESCRCYSNWWDRKIPERPSYEVLQQQVEALQREHTQLQALMRALFEFKCEDRPEQFGTENPMYEEGDEACPFFTEAYLYVLLGKEDARSLLVITKQLRALLPATMDATTPAPDTSIIGKCEPPSQWNLNAQVRGDIS